jgi:hypothetical protein
MISNRKNSIKDKNSLSSKARENIKVTAENVRNILEFTTHAINSLLFEERENSTEAMRVG